MKKITKKNKILCMLSYFTPAKNAGGPVKSINNMILDLNDSYEFSIITRCHDKGKKEKFNDYGRWLNREKYNIFYIDTGLIGLYQMLININKYNYDIIYINSFFDTKICLIPILFIKLFKKNIKIVIAPRGEFSKGALSIKKNRKYIFIKIFRKILFNRIFYHASTEYEKNDISASIGYPRTYVASNIIVEEDIINNDFISKDIKNKLNSDFKVIFLSRIVPIKNLLFLLDLLSKINTKIFLDIYGPIEDVHYWNLCLRKIDSLKFHCIRYRGEVNYNEVVDTFKNYDLFIFPTLGENFGHVIIESLSSGTPVLLSNRTPWRSYKDALKVVSLVNSYEDWVNHILFYLKLSSLERVRISIECHEFVSNINNSNNRINNIQLFDSILMD